MQASWKGGGNVTNSREYVAVLRAPSAARFLPEEGYRLNLDDIEGVEGRLEVKLRTRWVDSGFEAPIPRELWIEVRGKFSSIDNATAIASAVSSPLSVLLAFCANTYVGTPELHLAFAANAEGSEREFVQSFLPDETGLIKEGRVVKIDELAILTTAFLASQEQKRILRALRQYALSLPNWHFGSEWLALEHLYMAVEALTQSVIRQECSKRKVDEPALARMHNIDPDDPERPRWKVALESWCKEQLIFSGDRATYQAAKDASDGLEHGFMDLRKVHKNALKAVDATFKHVRVAVLNILGLEGSYPELYDRTPMDVKSSRKFIRGHFVGHGEDAAPPGQEYPLLEWNSSVQSMVRSGESFSAQFTEKLSVKCANGLSFRPQRMEYIKRGEPGQTGYIDAGQASIESIPRDSSLDIEPVVEQANTLVNNVASSGTFHSMSPMQYPIFGLFSQQVALFEAIHVLRRDMRSVEAIPLLERLLRGACKLDVYSTSSNWTGLAMRDRLDSLARQLRRPSGSMDAEVTEQAISKIYSACTARQVDIPVVFPRLDRSAFYRTHKHDMRFINEAARMDSISVDLHIDRNTDGGTALRTQIKNSVLVREIVVSSISAIISSVASTAKIFKFSYDPSQISSLQDELKKLQQNTS